MIYKVLYQAANNANPKREATKTLYLKANTVAAARTKMENNTDYNIEYIEPLEGKHLEFEQQEPDFKIMEFD